MIKRMIKGCPTESDAKASDSQSSQPGKPLAAYGGSMLSRVY
jgi:hypothetical protein